MPTVIEGLKNFLNARRATHNAPELLDLWGANMETQVNVSPGKGEPVDGRPNLWTDGTYEWHSIRIPKKANADPEFHDYELRFPFDLYAEGIGMTGWDWQKRVSRHFGFDFDSITGHAAGVGIGDEELQRVIEAAKAIPWVEVRASTGGRGLHLYVYMEPGAGSQQCENHTVHAACARAVLGMMSTLTGFDFAAQVDVCGGNMWVWHKKMTAENGGLRLIKPVERKLSFDELPSNWRANIEVVKQRQSKIRLEGVTEEETDAFELLCSSRRKVPLDAKHKEIIDELLRSGFTTMWVSDRHLLQTHTCAIQKLIDDGEVKVQGFFKTNSRGNNPGECNCFMYPMENGAWNVYRFSRGVVEAETWQQDKAGYTWCHFNRRPSLADAATAFGGAKRSGGGYEFDTAEEAAKVVEAMGEKLTLPDDMTDREAHLTTTKEGEVVLVVKKTKDEARPQGWATKRGGWWEKVFKIKGEQKVTESQSDQFDNIVRQLVTPGEEDAGWLMRSNSGEWQRFETDKIKMRLANLLSLPDAEVKALLGGAIGRAWKLVNLPFQDEYPGNRQWNIGAAQFVYKPTEEDDVRHPHWDLVLKHCGRDLTSTLKTLDWAQKAGITNGADYLKAWIACAFRCPFEPLPYLFFYGSQNCGKSIFHEALSELVTKGVVRADRALTNQNDFNGELANAIICVVEEKDISNAGPSAYNKIKDWVTGRTISIRKMHTDSYDQPNTTHWIQCANDPGACPIFPGDTRITMIYVHDLDPDQEIPKMVLLRQLQEEAPHFMRTLLDMELPPVIGRLRLPFLVTPTKKFAAENRQPEHAEGTSANVRAQRLASLSKFVANECVVASGRWVRKKKIFRACNAWLKTRGMSAYSGDEAIGQFSKDLLKMLKGRIQPGKKSRNGTRIHCFLGIGPKRKTAKADRATAGMQPPPSANDSTHQTAA